MSTAAEFARHRPHAQEARIDEEFVRVLFVEDRTDFAEEIHKSLGRASRGSFDVIRESDLVEAGDRVRGGDYDLLLIDLSISEVDRSTAIELATELAHRLPVVVLTGMEVFSEIGARSRCQGLGACIENADVPGKLLWAIRRSRRLGTGVMSPIFCRIEGLCTGDALR
ncbi:MAG TPA: response regulator [Myxococcota bacterium]|nr:response regulator [Myxococcota bacterium]